MERIFKTKDHADSLSSFHQKLDNIMKSKEFSQQIKDSIKKGMQNAGYKVD